MNRFESSKPEERASLGTIRRLLRVGGQRDELPGFLRYLTPILAEMSGCEAVGVRLRDGKDFPYVEYRGFSRQFVEAERWLCAHDPQGRPLLDRDGEPAMECMCGNVIQGRFDPAKPFFTSRGSFWANDTTRLLATTTDADRQAKTRNRCNGEGYESVALVRLSDQGEPLGLLQFNDHRTGMFTQDRLTLFEDVADLVGCIIGRKLAMQRERHQLEALTLLRRRTEVDASSVDVLLDEVNHRVNNNLSSMIGLLYAQEQFVPEPGGQAYRKILVDVVHRVEAIGIAHGILSGSRWAPISVQALVQQVVSAALKQAPSDKRVEWTAPRVDVLVSARQASPLALILHELTTNVVRHGLAERDLARVSVGISNHESTVRVEYRDDGPGFPAEVVEGKRVGAGLHIAKMLLSHDLRGKMSMGNAEGALVTLEFPVG